MKKRADHGPIFTPTPGGVLVQTGSQSDFSVEASSTYLAIKQRGIELQELFRKNGLQIPSSSYLAKLIDHSAMLSDSWICNDQSSATAVHLFSASQLDRIATAALPLGVSSQSKGLLSDLLSGSLDLLGRERSKAKDTLWELELWQALSRMGMRAALAEPDITVLFEGKEVGVACKKLYSENNVAKVLSQAVHQFESDFDFGIVAINIDDLMPANTILKANSIKQMSQVINKINYTFMENHERHLRRYLEPGRAICALISTAVIADVPNTKPRFFNSRQSVVWNIPGLPPEKEMQMSRFFRAVNAAHA